MTAPYQDPKGTAQASGEGAGEPTNEPGQYPASLFGVALPQGTGAPGTVGASSSNRLTDAAGEPGQYPAVEPISGVRLTGTGAPGSPGAMPSAEDSGDTTVTASNPSFYASTSKTVQADISGPDDWTATPGNYPPQHPIAGTPAPTSTGAGQGQVRRTRVR